MLSRQIQIRDKIITIQQDLSLSHAGTVWDGALVLAYYLSKNQKLSYEYFKGKNVLQLGSGTGILGLVVTLFEPKSVFLTDFQQFLPILKRNCEINKDNIKSQTKVMVCSMKWGDKQDMQRIKQIDMIVGSQLAYDVQNIGYLLDTFIFFIKQNKDIKILISYQKYENPNRNLYERVCKLDQLKCYQIDPEDMDQDYRDQGVGILLITSAF